MARIKKLYANNQLHSKCEHIYYAETGKVVKVG